MPNSIDKIHLLISTPRWYLRTIPWLGVDDYVYEYDVARFIKSSQEKLDIPQNIDILKENNSYFLSDLIKTIPIFESLSDDLIKEVLQGIYQKTAMPGTEVVKQGAKGDTFYIIISGQYEVLVETADGGQSMIQMLTGGNYFGEMALIEDAPRNATIRAKTIGMLLALNRETFNKVISNSESKEKLYKLLEKRKLSLEKRTDGTGEKEFTIPPLPNEYPEFISSHKQLPLSKLQGNFLLERGIKDYQKHLEQRFKVTVEQIEERLEWELLNDKKHGLIPHISPSMKIKYNKKLSIFDNLDHMSTVLWNNPSFFIAHPKIIEYLELEANHASMQLTNIEINGNSFISWRNIAIIPSDKILFDQKKHTSDILLLRAGEDNDGVLGLYNNDYNNKLGVIGYDLTELNPEKEDTVKREYKVVKHFSQVKLLPDAVAILSSVRVK